MTFLSPLFPTSKVRTGQVFPDTWCRDSAGRGLLVVLLQVYAPASALAGWVWPVQGLARKLESEEEQRSDIYSSGSLSPFKVTLAWLCSSTKGDLLRAPLSNSLLISSGHSFKLVPSGLGLTVPVVFLHSL